MRAQLSNLIPAAGAGALLAAVFFGPFAWLGATYSVGTAVLASALIMLLLGILLVKTEKWKTFEATLTAVLLFVFSPIVGGGGAVFGLIFGKWRGVMVLAGIGALLGVVFVLKGSTTNKQRKKRK